jgi:Methylamine utilisation protein MauE
MREVLIGPLAIAALVLGLAGAAKLRSPDPAARAAVTLGLPARRWLVRALAFAELGLAGSCLAAPGTLPAALLGAVYAGFAGIAVLLAHRQSACGCFGTDDAPATAAHWLLSALMAAVCAASARWTPHGLLWVLAHHPAVSGVLAIAVAGAAYAVIIVYSQLPAAWSAWDGR